MKKFTCKIAAAPAFCSSPFPDSDRGKEDGDGGMPPHRRRLGFSDRRAPVGRVGQTPMFGLFCFSMSGSGMHILPSRSPYFPPFGYAAPDGGTSGTSAGSTFMKRWMS